MCDCQYTKTYSATRDTHKRKRGRPVGRRELREKHLSVDLREVDFFRGKLDHQQMLVESPNLWPGQKLFEPLLTPLLAVLVQQGCAEGPPEPTGSSLRRKWTRALGTSSTRWAGTERRVPGVMGD
ncbi:hypothetical protein PG994_008388 [Apiospora phragmitis]|uniref:Uncharacterized protein n=1 Tax=Apiospora phragmitis TaxID=2905665 RepID=A0ABR1UT02_9PEZI